MSVDRNEKIWSYTYSGKMMHAFVQQHPGNPNLKRAMCRTSVAIGRVSWQDLRGQEGNQGRLCKACLKLANAMWDRAEASMEPADEADDLGYVAPVEPPLYTIRHNTTVTHIEGLPGNECEALARTKFMAGLSFSTATDVLREANAWPRRTCYDCLTTARRIRTEENAPARSKAEGVIRRAVDLRW